MKYTDLSFEEIVYVFQGGGALGAYQVGIFEALVDQGYDPTWMVGTSIGAINAAIITGNKPEERLPKLKKFWQLVSHPLFPGFTPKDELTRRWMNFISAQYSLLLGNKAFFSPRPELFFNFLYGAPDNLSYYILDPLEKTLKELINFDLINSGSIRLTLGAVEIGQGRNVYFDNAKQEIKLEHILASCALPPGFPAVKIDENYYWDGGIISNSPAEIVMRELRDVNTLCFMANLFDSYGLLPTSLDDVLKRHKDIVYSNEYRTQIQALRMQRYLYSIIRQFHNKLSDEIKADPLIKKLFDDKYNIDAVIHFVRFLYTAPKTELSSKDYEFSKLSMDERLAVGYQDGLVAVQSAPWFNAAADEVGVAVHEIASHPTLLEIMDKEETAFPFKQPTKTKTKRDREEEFDTSSKIKEEFEQG